MIKRESPRLLSAVMPAADGPRSTNIDVPCARIAVTNSGTVPLSAPTSSAFASKRISSRLPSRVTWCGTGGWTSKVTRAPSPDLSTRMPICGTRRSPTMIRRDDRRTSMRMRSAGPSARDRKSTGTCQTFRSRWTCPDNETTSAPTRAY